MLTKDLRDTLRKVEELLTYPATRNVIFRCGKGCEERVFRDLSGNGVALRVPEKMPLVTAP